MKTITVDKKELIGVLQDALTEIITMTIELENEFGLCREFEQMVEEGNVPEVYHTVKNYLEKIKEQ